MRARVVAFGASLALTLAVGFAWSQQSAIGGQSSRPVMQRVTVLGASSAAPDGWSLNLRSALPGVHWFDTDSTADERAWDLIANDDKLIGLARSDSFGLSSSWLTVQRTGAVVDSVTFPTEVQVGQAEPVNTSVKNLGVYSDVAAGAVFRETAADVETFVGANSTLGYIGTTSNHDFSIYSHATPRLTVKASGTVEVNGAPLPKITYGHYVGGSGVDCGALVSAQNVASCTRTTTGTYQIAFSSSYSGAPACTVTGSHGFVGAINYTSPPSVSGFLIDMRANGGANSDASAINFVCVGS